ncbi:MAG: Arc family DNA-binding protein [Cytophagaceae bacterium]|jgi:hypothetical protein|nr:Arc family DNA-binding protein [Cytophagaceae bacterium]
MEKEKVKTKTFVLRIDSEIMDAIEKWAADEFRSANGQILYLLDQALKKSGRGKKNRVKDSSKM